MDIETQNLTDAHNTTQIIVSETPHLASGTAASMLASSGRGHTFLATHNLPVHPVLAMTVMWVGTIGLLVGYAYRIKLREQRQAQAAAMLRSANTRHAAAPHQ